MGVHNLWELLAPVGRRVSVETLAGKKLAIDASIWMIQFMKAIRDEKGEMIRNAHLVGFFRRICKLLFLRVKPVFVFDGGTPALKRRTVIARRRQRENAQTKIRKTAEKLLLNQLKAIRLKELQKNLQEQRQDDLEPEVDGTRSVEKAKGKRVVDETIMANHLSEDNNISAGACSREELDAMLAASIAAEEEGSFAPHASTSGAGLRYEEDEDEGDDDEEMILPAMHGNVDPAVLAALPPSMQLDLLVQMRERLMAENRQRYQKVKKVPSRFSELQIQAYLKTVAFRREIDSVQKSAAGKGFGGMPTSRIASEANREYIFSSSFTGDKQVLTSGGEVKNDAEATENIRVNVSSKAVNDIVSVTRSNQTEECSRDTAEIELPNDVETYLDERGRIRLSRGRAMGIRMTRDLQRNLDLMKESEKESVPSEEDVDDEPSNSSTFIPPDPSGSNSSHNPKESNEEMCHKNQSLEDSTLRNVTSLEISFETNDDHKSDDDEDLFAQLVAGETLMNVPSDSSPAQKQSDHEDISVSDCEWEEGVIDGNIAIANKQSIHELKPYLADDDMDDDSMVEWEDGCASISKDVSPHPVECSGNLSRGALVEEAEYQEAIRRSLVDLKGCGDINASCENLRSVKAGLTDNLRESPSISKESSIPESSISAKENVELHKSSSETQTNKMIDKPNENQTKRSLTLLSGIGNKMINNQGELNMSQDSNNIDTQSIPYVEANVVDLDSSTEIAPGRCPNFVQVKTNHLSLPEEINESLENRIPEKDILIQEQQGDMKSSKVGSSMRTDGSSGVPNSSPFAFSGNLPTLTQIDLSHRELEAKVDDHLHDSLISESASFAAVENKSDFELKLSPGHDVPDFQKEKSGGNSSFMDNMAGQVPITEASLEEELLILDEESRELGNEHRRLERNAESVSSEMFAECQELLQMFGLPYIIAPMEAEAQCAFMELANLVDGVVTDDSDAFLFGARSVYKNIFDDRKYVETYFMKDIESELGLDRDKLIRMALLLGSDYTEGVSGIGIVNAIEVVNAFPEIDGLRQFREWIESPDPSILGKLDVQEGSGSRKRRSKVQETEKNNPSENSDCDLNMSQSADENKKLKQIFMEKHRNVSKNWHIPSTFPSDVVIAAYASPQVDNSTDSFSWGKPDLLTLHKVCWEKFGWGSKKADEVLLPVLKEYEKHETQLRLEAFYTFNEKFAKIRSKRIQSALKGVRGNKLEDVKNDSGGGDSKSKKKRKTNYVEPKTTEVGKDSDLPEIGSIKEKIPKISKPKRSKRKNSQGETVDEVDTRPSEEASMKSSARNGSSDKRDGSKRILSSGKRKKNKVDSSLEDARTSSDGEFNEETEERSPVECGRPLKVRRSERHRRAVNYTISSDDIVEECSTTASKLDGLMDETSQNQVIGNSSSGITPNEENKHENHQQESQEDFLQSGGGFCGEATERSQAYFGDINNAVVEDPLLEEYLKMGGGFCLEDDAPHGNTDGCRDKAADSSQVNSRSDGDLNAEDHISKECLESGGGFCLDDNETADRNRDNSTSVTMRNCAANAEEENSQSHPSQSISSHVSPDDDLCKGNSIASDTKNVSNRQDGVNYSGFSSPKHTNDEEKNGGSENRTPLRAMPNLRRKRRQT